MAAPVESTVSVYDGQRCTGRIVQRGGEYFAFDADGSRLGAFPTRAEALAAIQQHDRADHDGLAGPATSTARLRKILRDSPFAPAGFGGAKPRTR